MSNRFARTLVLLIIAAPVAVPVAASAHDVTSASLSCLTFSCLTYAGFPTGQSTVTEHLLEQSDDPDQRVKRHDFWSGADLLLIHPRTSRASRRSREDRRARTGRSGQTASQEAQTEA
jgi:hypothetical protein